MTDDDPWADLGGGNVEREPTPDEVWAAHDAKLPAEPDEMRCCNCGLRIVLAITPIFPEGDPHRWRHVATGLRSCQPMSVGLWAEP